MVEWYKKRFSELTTDELYELLRLRSEIFVVEQDCVYQDLDLKDKRCIHLFGMENGEAVAGLRIIPAGISYDYPSIGRLVVKETHRHNGYARKMMLEAIGIIKEELSGEKIRISGQAYLKNFYEGLGFVPVTDIYLEDGIEHYGFELDISGKTGAHLGL